MTCFSKTLLITGIIGLIISVTEIIIWFGTIGGVIGGVGVAASLAALGLGVWNSRKQAGLDAKSASMVYSVVEPLAEDKDADGNVNASAMSNTLGNKDMSTADSSAPPVYNMTEETGESTGTLCKICSIFAYIMYLLLLVALVGATTY